MSHCWLASARLRSECSASANSVISTPPTAKSTTDTSRHGARSGSERKPSTASTVISVVANRPGSQTAIPGTDENGQE